MGGFALVPKYFELLHTSELPVKKDLRLLSAGAFFIKYSVFEKKNVPADSDVKYFFTGSSRILKRMKNFHTKAKPPVEKVSNSLSAGTIWSKK